MLEYFLINPHKIKCVCRSRDDVNADSIKRVLERQQRARNTATMFASVRDDGVSRDEDGAAAADSQDIRRYM